MTKKEKEEYKTKLTALADQINTIQGEFDCAAGDEENEEKQEFLSGIAETLERSYDELYNAIGELDS